MISKVIRYIILALFVVGIVFLMNTLIDKNNLENGSNDGKTYTANIKVLDKETKKFVGGSEFVLKTSDGKVIEKWVSGDSVKRITNLENGTYLIVQNSAKDGYNISEKVTFKIYNSGKDVVIYNEAIVKEKIESEEVVVDNTLSLKSCFSYVISFIVIGIGFLLIGKRNFSFE